MDLELKLKLVTTSPVGGWIKTNLLLISNQVEVVVEIEVELGNMISAVEMKIRSHLQRINR